MHQSNLFASGSGGAGACRREGDGRGEVLDDAGQVVVSLVVAQLLGGKGHIKRNLHARGDEAFTWRNGQLWRETLCLPVEPGYKNQRAGYESNVSFYSNYKTIQCICV